ncbi:MAG: carboxypeptidase regulatory-like domain-containing protein [Planctomycetota bacterium]
MRLRVLLASLAVVSLGAMVIVPLVVPDAPEVQRRPERTGSARKAADPGVPAASRPAGWPVAGLEVLVRDKDGRGVAGAAVRIESQIGPHVEGYEIADPRGVALEAVTDDEGAGRFGSLPVGPYSITAESPEGRRDQREFVLTPDRGEVELVLPETPILRDFVVRVVDSGGGAVAGARVDVFAAVSEEPVLTRKSDRAGVARFEDAELEGGVILARRTDGSSGILALRSGSDLDPAVVLTRPGRLEGSLVGLASARLLEARVLAFALDQPEPYSPTHGAAISTPVLDGKYRFDSVPAGSWTLSISDPRGARLALPALRVGAASLPNSIDPIEVEVPSASTIVRDLQITEGGTIEGTVLTDHGQPVVGALVRDTFAPSSRNLPDGFVIEGAHVWRFDSKPGSAGGHPVAHASTRTDPGGRYRLVGLHPGRHRVEVLAAGLSYDRREGVEVEDGSETILEHVLESAGAIQGVEPRAGILGVTRAGREEVLMLAVLPEDGRFTFVGLAAGQYVLSRFHAEPGQPRSALATVDVEAGKTRWINLSRIDRPVRFLGRVVDGRGAVPGARVRVYPEFFRTDAEGRFEMRSTLPLQGPISVQVHRGHVETWFSLPGMPPGTTTHEKDFVLGDEAISVRTLDARGSPAPARLEIAVAKLRPPLGDVETLRFDPVFVDESGERAVAGLPPGEYTVRARFENGSEVRGSVSPPESRTLELRMPASGDLTVEVRGPRGAPELGRWVCVDPGGEAEPRWGETDVEGRVTFRGVDAREVLVRVRASRDASAGLDGALAEERVTISAGEAKSIALELPKAQRF